MESGGPVFSGEMEPESGGDDGDPGMPNDIEEWMVEEVDNSEIQQQFKDESSSGSDEEDGFLEILKKHGDFSEQPDLEAGSDKLEEGVDSARRSEGSVRAENEQSEDGSGFPPTSALGAASQGRDEEDRDGEEVLCSICLSPISEEQGEIDCCSHRFCYECLKRWKQERNVCPVCGQRFHVLMKVEDGRLMGKTLVGSDYDRVAEDNRHYFFGHTLCQICGYGDNDEVLLICDGCELGYHTFCIDLETIPIGLKWYCEKCRGRRRRGHLQEKRYLPPEILAAQAGENPSGPVVDPEVIRAVEEFANKALEEQRTYDLTRRLQYIHRIEVEKEKEKERKRRKAELKRKKRTAGYGIRVTEEFRAALRISIDNIKWIADSKRTKKRKHHHLHGVGDRDEKWKMNLRSPRESRVAKFRRRLDDARKSGGAGGWSTQEDQLLLEGVKRCGKMNWERISDFLAQGTEFSVMSFRTPSDCVERYSELVPNDPLSESVLTEFPPLKKETFPERRSIVAESTQAETLLSRFEPQPQPATSVAPELPNALTNSSSLDELMECVEMANRGLRGSFRVRLEAAVDGKEPRIVLPRITTKS